jgi:hypothetical protein
MALGLIFAGLTFSGEDDPVATYRPMYVTSLERPFPGASELDIELPYFTATFCFTGYEPEAPWEITTEIQYPEGDDREIETKVNSGEWPDGQDTFQILFLSGGQAVRHRASGGYRFSYRMNGEPLVTLLLPVYWSDERKLSEEEYMSVYPRDPRDMLLSPDGAVPMSPEAREQFLKNASD